MKRYGRPNVPNSRNTRLVCWSTAGEARAIIGEAQQRGISTSSLLRVRLGLAPANATNSTEETPAP